MLVITVPIVALPDLAQLEAQIFAAAPRMPNSVKSASGRPTEVSGSWNVTRRFRCPRFGPGQQANLRMHPQDRYSRWLRQAMHVDAKLCCSRHSKRPLFPCVSTCIGRGSTQRRCCNAACRRYSGGQPQGFTDRSSAPDGSQDPERQAKEISRPRLDARSSD